MAFPHASHAYAFVKELEKRVESNQATQEPGTKFGRSASLLLLEYLSSGDDGEIASSASSTYSSGNAKESVGGDDNNKTVNSPPSVMYPAVFRSLGYKMRCNSNNSTSGSAAPAQVLAQSPKKKDWVTPSVGAIVFWGLWGFLSNVGGKLGLDATQANLVKYSGIYSTLPLLSLLNSIGGKEKKKDENEKAGKSSSDIPLHERPKLALLSSFLSGVCTCSAGLFLSRAMERGDGGTVSTVTACYAPVTMGLGALFLDESITTNKIVGLVLAIIAQYFFIRS